MNFLVIVSDTLRRDFLGCYGNDWVRTPRLDALAADALVFERAYAASFPTVPHRRDAFTGRFSGTYSYWAPLPTDEVVIAEELSQAGYTTMMVNDCPHTLENGFHFDRGFQGWEWIRGQESDRWRTDPEAPTLPASAWKLRDAERSYLRHARNRAGWQLEEDRYAPRTMLEAGRWLERHHGASAPFFLYVDTFDPHEPWDAPPWYVEMYDADFAGEAVDYPLYRSSDYLSAAELRHVRALYAAEVTMVDRWVGHLLDRLEDTGHADDTVVVFTTDHGFLHGEHGYVGKSLIDADSLNAAGGDDGGYATIGNLPLWEEIAHIPLLVRVPGGRRGRTGALVQPPDVMPTVLELAGVTIPDTVQGRSFAGVLRGETDSVRDVALSFPSLVTGGLGAARITATTERWSYVCGATENDERFLEAAMEVAGGEFARDLMTSHAVDGLEKMIRRVMEPAPDELYDLSVDPSQDSDLVGAHPELARDLRAEVVERLRALGTAEHILACWSTPPG